MIRSIPNPPMGREDVARFRETFAQHLRGDFSAEERKTQSDAEAQMRANARRIIANCDGVNPLLP